MDSSLSVLDAIHESPVDGLDVVPANIDLSAAEIQLVNEVGREQALARALRPVMKEYDFIIIDCQPSLGLLTVNALSCADSVIIPVESEYFSLRGLALLMDTVEKVRDRLNFRLEVLGILVTMFDRRTLHSREVMERLVEAFGDKVFDSVITRTVRFPETSVAGNPSIRGRQSPQVRCNTATWLLRSLSVLQRSLSAEGVNVSDGKNASAQPIQPEITGFRVALANFDGL